MYQHTLLPTKRRKCKNLCRVSNLNAAAYKFTWSLLLIMVNRIFIRCFASCLLILQYLLCYAKPDVRCVWEDYTGVGCMYGSHLAFSCFSYPIFIKLLNKNELQKRPTSIFLNRRILLPTL